MNYFLIGIRGLVLVQNHRNLSQKSWKLILRTFILLALCAICPQCIHRGYCMQNVSDSPLKIKMPSGVLMHFETTSLQKFRLCYRRLVPKSQSAAAAAQGVRRHGRRGVLVEAVPRRHRGYLRAQRVLSAYESEGRFTNYSLPFVTDISVTIERIHSAAFCQTNGSA